MKNNKKAADTKKIVLMALFTAIVTALQFLGAFIRFGPFSISLVLMPIAIGAALMGALAGGWLGLVFGAVVLLSGDAAPFMLINPAATVFLVLLKGMLAGFASGAAYKLFLNKNKTAAAVAAAAACPVVNTGVFVAGVFSFFLPDVAQWGFAEGYANAAAYIFTVMIGFNFLIELVLNLVLSPVIVRLIQYGRNRRAA